MNNAEIKDEIRRMLGNMRTADPFYPDLQAWANRGVSDVVLMGIQGLGHGIDLFPELRCSWDSDLTINGINHQALPNDKLLITSAASYDKASPNHNYDRALPMGYATPERFDTISKPATRVGWPRLWTMRGHSFFYYPTPSSSPTDYRTKMLLHGIQKEPAMSDDDDTPIIDSQWHYACVLRGAAIGARAKDWQNKAMAWDGEVKVILGYSTDIGALEDSAQSFRVGVEGLIDRQGVYGG